jgi:hypothetical protein
MIWVWGHPADLDQWAYSDNRGWNYAHLKPIFQSIANCRHTASNGERGADGPMCVGRLAGRLPLTAGFLESCRACGYPVIDDVGAPIKDGAGYMDFNVKDGRRFSVVHGYLLPALERRNLTLLTRAHAEKPLFEGTRCSGVQMRIDGIIHEVAAEQETIVCAGAVESPSTLLLLALLRRGCRMAKPAAQFKSSFQEPETVVEPGGVHDFETVRPRTLISADEVEAIRSERLFLWVYGYIAYRDFLGQRHQHRFCKQLVPIRLGSRLQLYRCDSNPW